MNNDIFEEIRKGALITAGTIDDFNSMTIGWGTYGALWSKKVFIAYVKPCRYTFEFMEKNDYFTVSFYDDVYKKELLYYGTHSGRDVNKEKETKFNPVNVNDVAVTYKEAKKTLLLKKLYYQDLDINMIPEDIAKRYYEFDKPHRIYVGEIIEEL